MADHGDPTAPAQLNLYEIPRNQGIMSAQNDLHDDVGIFGGR